MRSANLGIFDPTPARQAHPDDAQNFPKLWGAV